jgi:hypothetical protein
MLLKNTHNFAKFNPESLEDFPTVYAGVAYDCYNQQRLSSPKHNCYLNEKPLKPGKLHKTSAVWDILEHWIEKFVSHYFSPKTVLSFSKTPENLALKFG